MESDFGERLRTDHCVLARNGLGAAVYMCVLIWGAALNEVQRGAAIERCADASNYRC